MSKSPKSHSNDRVASDALRTILPKTWLWKSPRDVDSGREHGEDCVIEIVDGNENATGAEFSVQNKVNPRVHKQYVSVSGIKLTTLERLIGLGRPVLLHAYDTQKEMSYWLWLDDWYVKFMSERKTKRPKTITVQIPLQNVLDEASAQDIRARVMWEHRKLKEVKVADLINQTNPDFRIEVSANAQSITKIINAKHDGAIPVLRPMDEAANQAMMYALQMGQAVQVNGRFAIEGVPSLLFENGVAEVVQAIICPVGEVKTFPLRVEFLNEREEVVFRSPHVIMGLVQPGTVVRRWEGHNPDQYVTYSMTQNYKERVARFEVKFSSRQRSAREWAEFLQITLSLKSAKKARLTNLKTDQSQSVEVLGMTTWVSLDELEFWRQFFQELSSIENALGIEINLPREFSGNEHGKVQAILEALRTGILSVDSHAIVADGEVLVLEKTPAEARTLVEIHDENGSISLFFEEEIEVRVDLFGNILNLGQGRREFPRSILLNIDTIKSTLDSHPADEKVVMYAQIDRQKTCIRLFNRQELSSDSQPLEL